MHNSPFTIKQPGALKRLLLLALCIVNCALCITSSAQDVHFSQWSNTPLLVNPALTGVFNGKLRFSNDYRSQWVGITKAYTTIHISLDAPIGRTYYQKSYFGVGGVIIQDQGGDGNLTNTSFLASLSYTAPMDDGDNFISVGFQGGLNITSFDASKATWDSQWNGDSFDPTLTSSEVLSKSAMTIPEVNAGILYHYVPDFNNSFYLGGSCYHITGQSLSLYDKTEVPMERRYTLDAGGEKSLNKDNSMWVDPKVLYMLQGQQQEITAGASFKSKLQFKSRYTNYRKDMNYSIGIYNRFSDALIFLMAFEYNNINFGFSYDYNTSTLKKEAGNGNAFEITLAIFNPIKKGERGRNSVKMPKFF